MCHERWFRRKERDERFEEELRSLMDREGERPDTPTPVVERKPGTQPVVELEPDEAPVASSR